MIRNTKGLGFKKQLEGVCFSWLNEAANHVMEDIEVTSKRTLCKEARSHVRRSLKNQARPLAEKIYDYLNNGV